MPGYLVPTPKEFGELVRGFRKQRGWTQARLAERAGLLPKTVSAIEAGNGQVLLANVMRCLSALEVDLSLESRPGPGAVPGPRHSTVDSAPVTEPAASSRTSRLRRTATGEHGAPGLPASGSTGRKAKQAGTTARHDKARRASAVIKALEENW
jgi:HTH-type transcriptional regulator/antitoxin HipB